VLDYLVAWEDAWQTPRPTLLIADRYGALYARYAADEENELPTPDVGLKRFGVHRHSLSRVRGC